MSEADPNDKFFVSRLQCEPYVGDWSAVSIVYIIGAEIVPDSSYRIDGGWGDTGIWSTGSRGDVAPPFEADLPGTQPDFGDIVALVNTFKNEFACVSKPQGQLEGAIPDPTRKVGFADIARSLEAFQGYAYPFGPPGACP